MSLFRTVIAALLVASGVAATEHPIRPGDRIAIIGNTFADQLRHHGYLETLLLQRTQGNSVSVRNLGWGGDMLAARDRPTHFPSEASTLRAHQTDIIIACFGLGESFAGLQGLADFRQDLEAFVDTHHGKQYNGRSQVRLVLISPIAYENLGKRTPDWERRNRELRAYTQVMAQVADESRIPFVNVYEASHCLMEEGAATRLTVNGVTPNAYGYWALSRTLAEALLPGKGPWRLYLDVKDQSAQSWGVNISSVAVEPSGLRFSVQEVGWPNLPPPGETRVHETLIENRDTLVVENLSPGHYRLEVDGEPVVSATHAQWATGIAIDASPAHRDAETFRQSVIDKNRQFTYGWKALNQVHIVGERQNSPSGRALPAELIEFNCLAHRKDEALRAGIRLQTREWRLTRMPH